MGRFLIIFSFTLLLLHSLLPHEHQTFEKQQTLLLSHHCEFSFFEWLTVTISQDLGANHLEEFQNGQTGQAPPAQFAYQTDVSSCFLPVYYGEVYAPALTVAEPPSFEGIWCGHLTFATHLSRRGPPVA